MAVTSSPYRLAVSKALAGSINWASDTIKAALVTSSYTPNADTDAFWSTPQANEITGTGYSAGGVTLGSKTVTYTAANSWGTSWATGTAYTAGQIIKPQTAQNNGHLYLCTVAGTSHASTQPTWPTTRGGTVTDNTVTWEECGAGITVVTAANPSWASSTLTARYLVFYDAQTGVAGTEPLIAYVNFGGSDVSTTNGTFLVTVDATLGIFFALSQ